MHCLNEPTDQHRKLNVFQLRIRCSHHLWPRKRSGIKTVVLHTPEFVSYGYSEVGQCTAPTNLPTNTKSPMFFSSAFDAVIIHGRESAQESRPLCCIPLNLFRADIQRFHNEPERLFALH